VNLAGPEATFERRSAILTNEHGKAGRASIGKRRKKRIKGRRGLPLRRSVICVNEQSWRQKQKSKEAGLSGANHNATSARSISLWRDKQTSIPTALSSKAACNRLNRPF
jgi:hypothetical protein